MQNVKNEKPSNSSLTNLSGIRSKRKEFQNFGLKKNESGANLIQKHTWKSIAGCPTVTVHTQQTQIHAKKTTRTDLEIWFFPKEEKTKEELNNKRCTFATNRVFSDWRSDSRAISELKMTRKEN